MRYIALAFLPVLHSLACPGFVKETSKGISAPSAGASWKQGDTDLDFVSLPAYTFHCCADFEQPPKGVTLQIAEERLGIKCVPTKNPHGSPPSLSKVPYCPAPKND